MNIDRLEKIRKAEASPFLFTRIQQRIADKNNMLIAPTQIRLVGLALAIIVCLNVTAIYNFVKPKNTVEAYAQALHLNTENSIY